jgi:hypothetical protein
MQTKAFRSAVLLTAAVLQPIHAQQTTPPPFRSVSHITVNTDRSGDMAAAIKEYNAILKKAQWDKNYTIWRSLTGSAEIVRVDYYDKWADLDKSFIKDPKLKEYQAELTRITQRITDSFQSTTRVIDLVNQEVSMPRPAEMPKMLMVLTAHVKEGKMQEAVSLEKTEYAPALKSAGIKSYTFAHARFGAPSNEIRSSVGLENWADLDQTNPVRKAMGDEKYRAFSAKMTGLLDDYRYEIYRFDAELSYVASK